MKKVLPVLLLVLCACGLALATANQSQPSRTVWYTCDSTGCSQSSESVAVLDTKIHTKIQTGKAPTSEEWRQYYAEHTISHEVNGCKPFTSDGKQYVQCETTYTNGLGNVVDTGHYTVPVDAPVLAWYETFWAFWQPVVGAITLAVLFVGLVFLIGETIRRAWVSEPKIESLETKVDQLDEKVDEIDDDLDTVEKNDEELDERLGNAFDAVVKDVNELEDKIEDVAEAVAPKKTRKKKKA